MPSLTVLSAFRVSISELNIDSKCKVPSLWSDKVLAFRGKGGSLRQFTRNVYGDFRHCG